MWSLGPDSHEAGSALAARLKDPNAGVRLNVAGALGAIGVGRRRRWPPAAARDAPGRRPVRPRQAADLLGKFGPAVGLRASELITVLKDRDTNVRTAAAYALAEASCRGGERGAAGPERPCQRRNGDVRTAALYALKQIQAKVTSGSLRGTRPHQPVHAGRSLGDPVSTY